MIRCDVCHEPIKTGQLWIEVAEARAVEDSTKAWQADVDQSPGHPVMTMAQLLDHPAGAPWHVTHDGCGFSETGYGFPIPDDTAGWLDVLAHLMEKAWIGHTDLVATLRRIAAQLREEQPAAENDDLNQQGIEVSR